MHCWVHVTNVAESRATDGLCPSFSNANSLDTCLIQPIGGESVLILSTYLCDFRDRGVSLLRRKSVVHEARDGVLMCRNHHGLFHAYAYYIHWMPDVRYCSLSFTVTIRNRTTLFSQFRRFVLVNHSQHPTMYPYHGLAINFNAGDSLLPFVIREMRGPWEVAILR